MILLFSQANEELGKWSHPSMGVRRTFAAATDLIHALLPQFWRISPLSDTPAVQGAATESCLATADAKGLLLTMDVAFERLFHTDS
jgi:hypothetical protein